jgi:hypothetical protein
MSIRKTGSAEPSEDPAVEVEGGLTLKKAAAATAPWSAEDEARLEEENVAADKG